MFLTLSVLGLGLGVEEDDVPGSSAVAIMLISSSVRLAMLVVKSCGRLPKNPFLSLLLFRRRLPQAAQTLL